MALTADRDLGFYPSEELVDLPVDANTRIYRGAFVGRNRATGYARPLVAGDDYLGIAYRQVDNTFAGNLAGGLNVRLHQSLDVVHVISGVGVGDVGKEVYASADDALTLVPTNNSRVGRIAAIDGVNTARVRCQSALSLAGCAENAAIILLADQNATLTLDHMNKTLLMTNTAARTLVLPSTNTVRAGAWFRIVKTNAAAFAITLDGAGSETVDGATTFAAIDAIYDTALVLCTGTEWVILSRDIS